MSTPELYIGLMSGTSLDGVDGVLADFSEGCQVLAYASAPFPVALHAELLALNQVGHNELHRAALAANALMQVYAQVVRQLLSQTQWQASQIRAIGAHGQTVRHQPQSHGGTGYTLQLCNPALLAELTHIDVVADFRSRDVAAGGQGAPLVPVFHQAIFGRDGSPTAVLNLGGMANLTVIGAHASQPLIGFDCGPGNVLMDAWCHQHRQQAFDADGAWAAGGQVHRALLDRLLTEPYFAQPAPKSTGRDLFNLAWLDAHLAHFDEISPQDVQATLTELTSSTCAACINSYAKNSKSILVCGGGAFNTHLLQRLQALLPACQVQSTATQGMPPLQVEAAAFAWLARQCVRRQPLALQSITGAYGARVAGGIYPA
ncbi:anhydro-N-acetylmuramic acid kinase [Rhodoferax sp.]|uniref:anhydro-N-acetylmuramic acid kinase n=1 Tax=Rhodoferax sp. TaxID=50421 RepID=UPI00261F2EA1|nr:anhydro-N-acetylmuramic acid kinase [Rhodoferax sp.]MDD2809406.1 anhydro-N-acetylmuramic acid kinase [Rhodoferax sp.]